MTVYTEDIFETLVIDERLHSNLSSPKASDTLVFRETLGINRHVVDVQERLWLSEKLGRVGGIFDLAIIEHITLTETVVPRIFVCDVFEVLAISESVRDTDIAERLIINETLVFDKNSVVNDTFNLNESLGFTATRNLPLTESLNLVENLTCVKISPGRPCIVGVQINTKSVTLNSLDNRYILQLVSPDFGNTEALLYTRVNKKTRGGDLIIYRDPIWPKTKVFTYTWNSLRYTDRNRLFDFMQNTLGQIINLLDYEGNNWLVYIKNPDTDISRPGRNANEVKLEFELQ